MEVHDDAARDRRYALQELANAWKLSPEIQTSLKEQGIASFFPVQAAAIPKLLSTSHDRTSDVCIAAPTGSGKTFVYAIPIVQRLISRVVCRLRALVVLPSRDLAVQVHQVLSQLCANTPLRCGLAIGQSNFTAEQISLVGSKSIRSSRVILHPTEHCGLDGGTSQVDILVATPGRLVDHLEQTPGFTLQHLQLLVVDEADRLLNQSYQDWIPKMYASIFPSERPIPTDEALHPTTCRRQDTVDRQRLRTPLTRVLLSATLTRNPRKLAAIGMSNAELTRIGRVDDPLADDNLREGHVGDMDEQEGEKEKEETGGDEVEASGKMYSTPSNLEECYIECEAASKPLLLLEILHDFAGSLTIVFTASLNATHRLARLLQLSSESPDRIQEYSSSLTQKQRSKLVARCKSGEVDTVVCSDAMARGMDMDNVANVVNYDVPSFVKTYIHRVGRTARAGRQGRCVTLVKSGQVKSFIRMLEKADTNELQDYAIDQTHMKTLVPAYKEALERLKDTLEGEKTGVSAPKPEKEEKKSKRSRKRVSANQTEPIVADGDQAMADLYSQLQQNIHKRLKSDM